MEELLLMAAKGLSDAKNFLDAAERAAKHSGGIVHPRLAGNIAAIRDAVADCVACMGRLKVWPEGQEPPSVPAASSIERTPTTPDYAAARQTAQIQSNETRQTVRIYRAASQTYVLCGKDDDRPAGVFIETVTPEPLGTCCNCRGPCDPDATLCPACVALSHG